MIRGVIEHYYFNNYVVFKHPYCYKAHIETNMYFKIEILLTKSGDFLASGDFGKLLITFPNSLDLNQNAGPDLDPNCWTP